MKKAIGSTNPRSSFRRFARRSASARKEPAMIVFTSKGQCVDPFGGNNVLQKRGVVGEHHGDGFVECPNTISAALRA
jgi:hypothetical protein